MRLATATPGALHNARILPKTSAPVSAIRVFITFLLSMFIIPFAACESQHGNTRIFQVSTEVMLDVVVFNYCERPIFDVYLNNRMIGGSASLRDSPYGQNSTVTGVPVRTGPQTLTWRLGGPRGAPRNGEAVTARAPHALTADQIPAGGRYLGVHIYPDESVDLLVSPYRPEQSERGLNYARELQKNAK